MKSERRTRRIDWRTSASTSVKDSIAKAGATPVASSQLGAEAVVADLLHAAVGVVDQHHLARPQLPLRDGERADHVVGDDAAGVAQHVRLAVTQPERGEDVESRVHAGDDRQPAARADVEVALGQRVGEGAVVGEQLVDRVHRSAAYCLGCGV